MINWVHSKAFEIVEACAIYPNSVYSLHDYLSGLSRRKQEKEFVYFRSGLPLGCLASRRNQVATLSPSLEA